MKNKRTKIRELKEQFDDLAEQLIDAASAKVDAEAELLRIQEPDLKNWTYTWIEKFANAKRTVADAEQRILLILADLRRIRRKINRL